MNDGITVHDFVMLGRTVPEPSKKYGLVVCSAGYSRSMRQFLRVYPLFPSDDIPKWSVCRLDLWRNEPDSRHESWRLREGTRYEVLGTTSAEAEWGVLQKLRSDSIDKLNTARQSLGILRPTVLDLRFRNRETVKQLVLFEEEKRWQRVLHGVPCCTFTDEAGFNHTLQLREWGNVVFLTKFPEQPDGLWKNLALTDTTLDHLFFVGNMNHARNAWLIISTMKKKKTNQLTFNFQEVDDEAESCDEDTELSGGLRSFQDG